MSGYDISCLPKLFLPNSLKGEANVPPTADPERKEGNKSKDKRVTTQDRTAGPWWSKNSNIRRHLEDT